MAGLRDVVRALSERPGVSAVMVVSGDGLTIDQAGSGLDADTVAALVPTIVSNAKRLGASAGQGELTLGAFAFIDLFWWAGEVWGLGRKAWLAEVAFIAFVAALVLRFVADPWFERRRRRRARGAPTSPPR